MRPLTCVIIDDEPLALDVLAGYCAQVPMLELKGRFHDALEALTFVQYTPIDLAFVDIHMPRITGLQLAQLLPRPGPRVVFTTAYHQYAVESYSLSATDYLLKPIAFERFLQAVNKVRTALFTGQPLPLPPPALAEPAAPASAAAPDAMYVKTEHRLQRIAFDDILYIEGQKEYLMLYTESGKIMTLQSFLRVEEVLPPERFARIHKSYIVALNRIEHVERGKVQVAGRLLPIGDTYRDIFNLRIRAQNLL
ncbi:LytTR family DNA-binding domain-containing protein [Hymenobacter sp. BT730]|uniref:LytR/AlgR family response regulator transcription factor n=1 Tax=Hymenobacter sp. BT730 TaxID=3063332 RepID=UPI0026DF9A5B|nr:LytTR family DNA-binding domain-containing protein [Hymenobacter sp. BT730]